MTAAASVNGTRTVAIVADDPGLSDTLQHALAADGYSCTRCACAEAAALGDGPQAPALILADLSDGGRAAIALCQSMRARDGDAACRLLVLHHSGRSVDRRRAQALGADGFLAMPFALDELRQEVARLLSPDPG